jgi:hypothetical protein
MTYPQTEIDKIGYELDQLTEAYALKANDLASDPYFRAAVMKVSVSSFVWALFHAFTDDLCRLALAEELAIQQGAIERTTAGRAGPATSGDVH